MLLQDWQSGETLTLPLSNQEAESIIEQVQGNEPQGFLKHFVDLAERQGWGIDSLNFYPITGGAHVRLVLDQNGRRENMILSPGEALQLSISYGVDLTLGKDVALWDMDCSLLAGSGSFLFAEDLFLLESQSTYFPFPQD